VTMQDNNGRDRQDQELLALVEQELSKRSRAASELPWLEVSVTAQIEARERARQWLSNNGSLFRISRERGIKGSVAGVRRLIGTLTGALGNSRLWTTIGAVLGGAAVGYLISGSYPGPALLPDYSLPVTLSVAGALVAGIASQWTYLKEYYS